jgi:hypothetical protein
MNIRNMCHLCSARTAVPGVWGLNLVTGDRTYRGKLVRHSVNDGRSACEIKSRTAMAKVAVNKKRAFLLAKLI